MAASLLPDKAEKLDQIEESEDTDDIEAELNKKPIVI